MKPANKALMAISSFLKEEGFVVSLNKGYGDRFSVEVWVAIRCGKKDDIRTMLRLEWFDGELMLIRWAAITPRSKAIALDGGARFFELADPNCFDQIVNAVRSGPKL